MRPISWLHISDFHMRKRDAWSLDVVLKALCERIAKQRKDGVSVDFILATGDLAFSGNADEYKLVAAFFDAISTASGVSKDRIFSIPGNHDVERDRQRMCFHGTRNYVQSENHIDELLSPGDDIETLLKRQENYRNFQSTYFVGQDRTLTSDGLGYVSCIAIGDVRIAVVGLNSAWLSEGDEVDHGKLLIGERQVINAVKLAELADAHIVIGIGHHPLHWLQDFDRRPVQDRIERLCHFYHCGHLHEPEARKGSGCLILAAGASFKTRQFYNSYSFATLYLLRAHCTVKTIQYNPANGAFEKESSENYPIEITPFGTCSVAELAQAMKAYRTSLSPWAHYLSALLLDQKSELPIAQNSHVFGSFAVLLTQPDGELWRKTVDFMAFKNVLRVFYPRLPLSDLFKRYGDAVGHYGAILEESCKAHPELTPKLAEQEKDAKAIAAVEPHVSFSHTGALLAELASACEWDQLRAQAERHVDSTEGVIALLAKRMLALSLAHSDEAADKSSATVLYRSLILEDSSEPTDTGNYATLLIDAGNFEEAKRTVLDGIEKFPANTANYFFQIGSRIVEARGDRDFRKQLAAAVEARGKRD